MIGLRITDGYSTIDLQAGDYKVMRYVPKYEGRDAETVAEIIGMESQYTDVGQGLVRNIEQMITHARNRKERGYGRRVFLEFNLGTAGEAYWRSEIVDGQTEMPEDTFHYDLMSDYLAFNVYIVRMNFWERLTETECNLQSSLGGSVVNQLTIYNSFNAGAARSNLFRITSVLGDVETPCRLEFYNNYSNASGAGDVLIGHMLEDDTNTLEHVIEGEASGLYGTSSYVGSGSASGGSYYSAGGSGVETIKWSAPIIQSMQRGMAGNDFNVMVRMPVAPSSADIVVRASIATEDGLSGLIERWTSGEVIAPVVPCWMTLGRVQLPPKHLTGLTLPAPLRLRLFIHKLDSGAYTLPIDQIMFMPVFHWRALYLHSFNLDYQITLHDRPTDGETQAVYTDGWAGGKYDNYSPSEDPIMLTPDRQNLFCVAMGLTDNAARTLQVKVFYRERRLAI